jgi:hypothetical protein
MPIEIIPYWKRTSKKSEKWRLWFRVKIKQKGKKDRVSDHSTWATIMYRPWFEMYIPGKYTANMPTKLLLNDLKLNPHEEIWSPKLNARESREVGAKWKKKILKSLKKYHKGRR